MKKDRSMKIRKEREDSDKDSRKSSSSDQERREQRRRRRRRNQAAAYITVILLIAATAVGIVLGIKAVTSYSREQEQEQQQEQKDKVDSLLESEDPITVPDPADVSVELTDAQKLDDIVNAGIEVMPLEDKVAGLFIVTPEAITGVNTAVQAGEGTQKALNEYAVGGIVYFSQNMKSEEQLKTMIDNTKLYANYPLFIAVDEEGGSVSSLAEAGLAEKVDTAQSIGQSNDANKAYQAGITIGGYLSDFGFNLDFAPVADLNNVDGSIIGDRSFGSDVPTVSSYVSLMMQGLQEQKVTPCLKHFPGIGSTAQDTHNGMAATDRSEEDFRTNEFPVFQAGIDAGADMIMVGHMSAPALTGDNTPCSLSSTVVTDILRNEMNFKGVIITDAMNMGAVTSYYGADQAAVLALRAGCDMILMPEEFETAYKGVLQAVQEGTISEERINDSLRRIYRIKYADKIGQGD